ncbi:MAG: hypothetical protein HOE73_06810 [Bacteroidetes Order II. Incertae sedis bacterium]|nr:hypothetical protein [Bacteroidetes Order II. bacterium]
MLRRSFFITLVFGVLLATVLVSGCDLLGDDLTPSIGNVDVIGFEPHIQPILDRQCASCHGGSRPRAGLSLEGWTQLIQGSEFGEVVIPFASEDSRMIQKLKRVGDDTHPFDQGKDRLSEDEVNLLTRWVDEGAIGPLGAVPFSNSINLAYIAHADEPYVSVLDMDAFVVVRRLDLTQHGFSERARVHHVAVEPDGAFWYASVGSYRIGDLEGVVKFNRDNGFVAQYEMDDPGLIALNPSEDAMIVSREFRSDGGPKNMIELRRSDLVAVQIPVSFEASHALAVRPQADYAFSASMAADQIVIVDLANLVVQYYPVAGVSHSFRDFAMAPNGRKMCGTGVTSGAVTLLSVSNPPHIQQRQSLNVGRDPHYLTYLPDASKVYVTVTGEDKVAVLDAYQEIIDKTITHPALKEPTGIVTSSDGRYVFVASKNTLGDFEGRDAVYGQKPPGTVVVIDTAQNEVVKVIEVGPGATTIGTRF